MVTTFISNCSFHLFTYNKRLKHRSLRSLDLQQAASRLGGRYKAKVMESLKLLLTIILFALASTTHASTCGAKLNVSNTLDSNANLEIKSFFTSQSGNAPAKGDTSNSKTSGFNTKYKLVTIPAQTYKEVIITFFCSDLWVNYKVQQTKQIGQLNWANNERTITIK